ncbi:Pre-mRNA-processing factor 39 [Frankliniella fusca]|uniref:Pre-mRNA-processing factor 39 n=1 Tax=Frankliniella fusca TaxID=407009 RepID=A0AAE1LLL3_9NEOP|nr:Pre-mRNA-processing factor 39 [Frankliniella fusca]
MASGSEDEIIGDGEEEVRTTRSTRASTRRGKKAATPARGPKTRRGRAAAASSGDSSMEVDEMDQLNGTSNENGNSDAVPELDDAPPPPTVNNVQPSPIRTGIKLKSNSISEEVPEDQTNTEINEDIHPTTDVSDYLAEATGDESMDEPKPAAVEESTDNQESNDRQTEQSLPPVDTPEVENGSIESGAEAPPKKTREASKRKLPVDGEYDPSSPTSENENEENPAKKAALSGSSPKKEKEAKAKLLPELEKYWKAVKDDPADFTGWTYLLQYVDQENDVEAAREAYDAFLSNYPYCYGYWRKFADYEKKKGNKDKCEEDVVLTALLYWLNHMKSLA